METVLQWLIPKSKKANYVFEYAKLQNRLPQEAVIANLLEFSFYLNELDEFTKTNL